MIPFLIFYDLECSEPVQHSLFYNCSRYLAGLAPLAGRGSVPIAVAVGFIGFVVTVRTRREIK